MKTHLPSRGDFPPDTKFHIKEFEVPLMYVPGTGWLNWFGGKPTPYDVKGLKIGNNWEADSYEQWLKILEDSTQ